MIFFEERDSRFMNLASYALLKKGKRGAPEGQKVPRVDRSFPVRCGKLKWRFSLQSTILQNSPKMERFLYGTKTITFFLLLTFLDHEHGVHLFVQPFLNTFLDKERIIGECSR